MLAACSVAGACVAVSVFMWMRVPCPAFPVPVVPMLSRAHCDGFFSRALRLRGSGGAGMASVAGWGYSGSSQSSDASDLGVWGAD